MTKSGIARLLLTTALAIASMTYSRARAESPREVQAKIDAMNQYGQVYLPLMSSGQIKRSAYFRGLLDRVFYLPQFVPGRDLKLMNVRTMLEAAAQVESETISEEQYQAIRDEVIASEAQAFTQNSNRRLQRAEPTGGTSSAMP